MRFLSLCTLYLALWSFGVPDIATAQDSLLNSPLLEDQDFDRGRNESVTDRHRMEYAAQGIRSGSISILPQIRTGVGFTSNAFRSTKQRQADGFAILNPSLTVQSEWSRHHFNVSSSAHAHRFFSNTARNETAHTARARFRADVGTAIALNTMLQSGKAYETPFANTTDAAYSGLSSYDFHQIGLRGVITLPRHRFTLGYQQITTRFHPIAIENRAVSTHKASIPQKERDRAIKQVSAKAEYAFSPDTAFFAQAIHSTTEYSASVLPSGLPNRNSKGFRVMAGASFDLTELVRGTVGAGYMWQEFQAPFYPDVKGVSVEAKVEYFLSPLTTLTLSAQRILQDSSLDTEGAYFDTRTRLRVDHELLYNLILNADATHTRQSYIGSDHKATEWQASTGARYLMSRHMEAGLAANYASKDRSTISAQTQTSQKPSEALREFRLAASLTFKY